MLEKQSSGGLRCGRRPPPSSRASAPASAKATPSIARPARPSAIPASLGDVTSTNNSPACAITETTGIYMASCEPAFRSSSWLPSIFMGLL